jgi:opacity protein-like surface antigen
MKFLFAAAAAGLAAAATPAAAADLFGSAPPMTMPATSAPTSVEVGSNWYIRGDIGASFDQVPSVILNSSSVPPGGSASMPIGVGQGAQFGRNLTADVGVGYRYNDWLRFEATYDYRNGVGGSSTFTVICPYTAKAVTQTINGVPTPVGVAYDSNQTCDGVTHIKQWNNMFLGSAYVDLGTYYGVSPYVGAGAGVNINTARGGLNFYKTSDGSNYAANLIPPNGVPGVWVNPITGQPIPNVYIPFAHQDWNRAIHSSHVSLAVALMAGFGIELTPSATLDIGYRYLHIGSGRLNFTTPTGAAISQSNTDHEVRVGVRYAIQ